MKILCWKERISLLQEEAHALSESRVFLLQKLADGHKFAFKAGKHTLPASTLTVVCNHRNNSALIPSVGNPKGTAAQKPRAPLLSNLSLSSRELPWSHLLPACIITTPQCGSPHRPSPIPCEHLIYLVIILPLPTLFPLLEKPFPPFSASSYFLF